MYEVTSTCPYIGYCGDVQTLQRVEVQLIRKRRELFSVCDGQPGRFQRYFRGISEEDGVHRESDE